MELTALFSAAVSVPPPRPVPAPRPGSPCSGIQQLEEPGAAVGGGGQTVKNKELMVKAEGLAGELSSRLGPSEYFYQALQNWLGWFGFFLVIIPKHTLGHRNPPQKKNKNTKQPKHVLLVPLSNPAPWQGFGKKSFIYIASYFLPVSWKMAVKASVFATGLV